MRILGRVIFALVLLVLAGAGAALLVRAFPEAEFSGLQGETTRDLDGSIVYPLRREATEFVFSQPQQRARILTSAGLMPNRDLPYYAYEIEGLNEAGQVVWKKTIHLRSLRLFVRGPRGRLIPHAFTSDERTLVPSASDTILLDFGRPISAVRLREYRLGAGVGRILARVQERRPVPQRDLQIGWQRLSDEEQEELAAGSALDPALLTGPEKRALLIRRWNPVGPSGIRGRNYLQTMLYELPGEKIPAPAVGG